MTSRTEEWSKEILGQPQSKANSRRIVFRKGVPPRSIKSQAALDYLYVFRAQCPALKPMFTTDVEVDMDIYYGSRRPDLDESLILDALQGRVYLNDRQVKRKNITWHLDQKNPRVFIRVRPLGGGNVRAKKVQAES